MHPTQNQAQPVVVTPAIILRAAATYIERYGWTQNDYYLKDEDLFPAACALGAIGMAAYGRVTDFPEAADHLPGWHDFITAYRALNNHLWETGELLLIDEYNRMTIGDWNDRPEQTHEAVVEALTAAADDWDRTYGGAA